MASCSTSNSGDRVIMPGTYSTGGWAAGWKTLREAIELTYNTEALRGYARLLGVKGPTRKPDLAQAIADSLLGADLGEPRLERVWEMLDETQKTAVAEAVHGDGVFDRGRFHAKYGQSPSWYGDKDRWRKEVTPLGLFLVDDPHGRGGSPSIPNDLADRLRRFVPPPRKEELQSVDQPVALNDEVPLLVAETERTAQQELFAVLRLIDMGKVQVSDKTKRPSTKGLAAVHEVLVGGDFLAECKPKDKWAQEIGPIRAFAWPLIVQAAGLAAISGTRLALSGAGRKALSRPACEILGEAWKRWIETTLLDEFSRVDVIKGQSDRKRMTAVADRRRVINGFLRNCPRGQWIEVDELSRHMQAAGKVFGVTHDPWRLYISDAHYGSLGYDGYHNWSVLQGRYLMALLFEYAATMGLLDLAYSTPVGARDDYTHQWGTDDLEFLSRYDGLSCFRINALGAYILGIARSYEPAVVLPQSGIKVLANLEVVAGSGRFEPGDEAFLAVFCTRRSEAVFSLDRAMALAAIEKGHRADELRSFFERACGSVLPETARAFLDDLERRSAMLSVTGHAILIECADETAAIRIANDAKTKRLCLLAGARTMVVPAQSEPAFRRAVLDLGYPIQPQRQPLVKAKARASKENLETDAEVP